MIHSTLLVFLVQGVIIQPSDARRSLQVETSEVEEADDVNEAAEVLRGVIFKIQPLKEPVNF